MYFAILWVLSFYLLVLAQGKVIAVKN